MITYQVKPFSTLETEELYQLLRLRNEVFVVEQHCAYQDLDNKDQASLHVLGYHDSHGLVACARIVPPGLSYIEPSIGRVLVRKDFRNTGEGQELMRFSIEQTQRNFPDLSIRISAQAYLEGFYQSLGFHSTQERYLEDGIPHLAMVLNG